MDTCRKSGIEEISNYAVRLQDKGDKEARENIDKLMIFYVSLGCKFATNEKVPCIYACYAHPEHSSFFSDNHISRRL